MSRRKKALWRIAGLLFLVLVLFWELTFFYLYRGYDDPTGFRRMEFQPETMEALTLSYGQQNKKFIRAVTGGMLSHRFRLAGRPGFFLLEGIPYRLFLKPAYSLYESWYRAILSDLSCFPVKEDPYGESVTFDDSWMGERTYGGRRFHEGTDIMTSNNVRGYFTVVSITDGVVEKMGWLEKGGWRVGIRSPSGAYFYYAHLDSYAPGLKVGSQITAGAVLGQMGDSGYGPEGTLGKFDVHLHVGIYIDVDGRELSINPYSILLYLKNISSV